ncbi:MAG: hypothetical protein ACR2M1_02275 [Gemmatimonadaceae bacterium]
MHQVHLLAIGPQGEILGRLRAYTWRVARSAVTVQADTVIAERAGRTTTEFRLMPPAPPLAVSFPIVVVSDTAQKPYRGAVSLRVGSRFVRTPRMGARLAPAT